MNGSIILKDAREDLAEAVLFAETHQEEMLKITPWAAMSMLQKGVRRGRSKLALQAAATLLFLSPERLWRRIGAIAFEDIGVGDLQIVSRATAALSGKRFRGTIGADWKVASFLVSHMVQARQCRAADDLLLAAEAHPTYRRARNDLATKSTDELIRIAAGSAELPVRAIAAWYAIGTDRRPSSFLHPRKGEPSAFFDGLCEAGVPHTVVEIGREGFRRIGEVLCPFLSLLRPLLPLDASAVAPDDFPTEVMIGEIPAWAYDIYTREGRSAYQAVLRGNSESARWVRAHVPKARRVDFLGTAIFRVEGGLVQNRLRWTTGDDLRRMVDIECFTPVCSDASEFLDLVRADIALVNKARLSHVG